MARCWSVHAPGKSHDACTVQTRASVARDGDCSHARRQRGPRQRERGERGCEQHLAFLAGTMYRRAAAPIIHPRGLSLPRPASLGVVPRARAGALGWWARARRARGARARARSLRRQHPPAGVCAHWVASAPAQRCSAAMDELWNGVAEVLSDTAQLLGCAPAGGNRTGPQWHMRAGLGVVRRALLSLQQQPRASPAQLRPRARSGVLGTAPTRRAACTNQSVLQAGALDATTSGQLRSVRVPPPASRSDASRFRR